MKINNFRGELIGFSALKEPPPVSMCDIVIVLVQSWHRVYLASLNCYL